MGLEKPHLVTLSLSDLIDPDALRRDLTALAVSAPDPGGLRKEAWG